MADTINNVEKQIVWVEPTTQEGFRLRSLELATDLARQRTNASGIQFTTDDIVASARKIHDFVMRGF